MSDISEPQDLEKAHISAWFTLAKYFEEVAIPDIAKLSEASYVLPRKYSSMIVFYKHLKFSVIFIIKCFGRYSFTTLYYRFIVS